MIQSMNRSKWRTSSESIPRSYSPLTSRIFHVYRFSGNCRVSNALRCAMTTTANGFGSDSNSWYFGAYSSSLTTGNLVSVWKSQRAYS